MSPNDKDNSNEEVSLIEAYLKEAKVESEGTSNESVVQRLAQQLLAVSESNPQGMFSVILGYAQDEAAVREPLLKLVLELKKQSKPDQFDEFGWAVRDEWNFTEPEPDTNLDAAQKLRNRWRNLNAFTACLANHGEESFLLNGLWTLRAALEDREAPESSVPAAAEWIEHAGQTIYNCTESYTPEDDRSGDPAKPGRYFKGERGFNKERWSFWRNQFQVIAGKRSNHDQVTKSALSADAKMSVIEMDSSQRS